eukprot:CAMPEP_0118895642 /NCGR_PEP_ID=MMETSP1166-20130328/3903_1 /TAXON_ID=1104430 /ORGANISM="Chrysoreinhardia sp, Strain CCMP3193" /LENGTH=71 /DNA_ID=CAMNT_0006834687 /DNA_START=65 /DNA_END=280 /DNA_ORIENTATION=+
MVSGTSTFLSVVVACCAVTVLARCVGMVSKDMAYVSLVLYPLAGFCGWLLWLCSWMHQWHPLLDPIYPQAE